MTNSKALCALRDFVQHSINLRCALNDGRSLLDARTASAFAHWQVSTHWIGEAIGALEERENPTCLNCNRIREKHPTLVGSNARCDEFVPRPDPPMIVGETVIQPWGM